MKTKLLSLALALPLLACSSLLGSEQGVEERTAEFHVQNAQRLYDGGHYAQALQQFEKALSIDDDSRAALLGRAWSLLYIAEGRILNRRSDADDYLSRAEDAFTDLKGRSFGADDYKVDLGIGKIHVLYGDLYAARAELYRRREGDPLTAAESAVLEETTASRDAEYGKARQIFEGVLARTGNPGARDNLVALIHLARIGVLQRNYNSALIYAERYLKQVQYSKDLWVHSSIKYPEDKAIWEAKLAGAVLKEVEVRDLIADILFKLGRNELAEQELSEVIFLSPERGDAYLNRAIVRERLGKREQALEDYKSFMVRAGRLDLSPEDPRVLRATERIIALEKTLGLPPSIRLDAAEK